MTRFIFGITRRMWLLAALGVLALSGCASTGGVHATAKPLPAVTLHSQKSLHALVQQGAQWPSPHWWKTVGDSQLDALVTQALKANPTLTLVAARTKAAFAAAGAVEAKHLPNVGATAKIAGLRAPPMLPPVANGHFGKIRMGYLGFSWSPDIWGGQREAWQAAVGKARATAVDAQAAKLKLAADVVQAYFSLAGAQRSYQLAEAELKRSQHFLSLTQQRVDQGVSARFTLERIKGEIAIDKAHVQARHHGLVAARLQLAALLGKGPDFAQTLHAHKLPDIKHFAVSSALPANLLGRRPDVIAARWRVEAADNGVAAAEKSFLPNLSISALVGLIAPSSMKFFDSDNRFISASPALALPIFSGGKLRANLAAKDADYGMAVAKYNQTLIHAINQVAGKADALRSLSKEANNARAAREHAQRAYQLSLKRYHAGVGSYLEALTVREQLIKAEQALANMTLRRANAWAGLNLALGGGFVPADDAPSLHTQTHTSTTQAHS